MKTLTLLLAFAVPATASPIALGPSWDGAIGTFANITGTDPEIGHADFQSGNWRITVDGGYSAWLDRDIVGFNGDSFCSSAAIPCALGGIGTVLQVYQDRSWYLWAETPGFPGRQTSRGQQFAFVQTSATTWRWALEDIAIGAGDQDFQDRFGTLIYLGPGGLPSPQAQTPVTTPEPFTIILVAGALAFARLVRR